jgi:hypothetical protein
MSEIFSWETSQKTPLDRVRHILEENIKMYLSEVGCEDVEWIKLEEFIFWNIRTCSPLTVNRHFGGDMFLQKVRLLSTDYMALYSRRQNSA